MARIVLHGIVQIPNGSPGRAHEILQRTVFEKGRLKSALFPFALVVIWRARRAGPYLRDVTIAAIQHRQTRLRTHDAPVRVVDEAMRRDIATDVAAGAFVVSLHVTEDLLQGAAIKEVFQLRGAPLAINGFLRRLPGFVIKTLPLALEPFRVTGARPEFRLFEMNRFDARIEPALHTHAQELAVIRGRAHVVNITAVTDLLSIPIGLRVVLGIRSIETTVEIILIIAPRHTRHQVHAIAA